VLAILLNEARAYLNKGACPCSRLALSLGSQFPSLGIYRGSLPDQSPAWTLLQALSIGPQPGRCVLPKEYRSAVSEVVVKHFGMACWRCPSTTPWQNIEAALDGFEPCLSFKREHPRYQIRKPSAP